MSLSIRERNRRVERVQKILDDSRSHSCYDTDYGRDCFRCDLDDPDYWTYRIDGLTEVNQIVEILLGEDALTEENNDDKGEA